MVAPRAGDPSFPVTVIGGIGRLFASAGNVPRRDAGESGAAGSQRRVSQSIWRAGWGSLGRLGRLSVTINPALGLVEF